MANIRVDYDRKQSIRNISELTVLILFLLLLLLEMGLNPKLSKYLCKAKEIIKLLALLISPPKCWEFQVCASMHKTHFALK